MASVALYEERVLGETSWRARRAHSSDLLPILDAMLQSTGVDKASLEAIAVVSGPGSYSGLRVGLTTASGLGLALGIGVVSVPTLEALAYAQGPSADAIRAAVEVGRGRYASACFRRDAGLPDQQTEIASTTLEELCQLTLAEDSLLVVDLDPGPREETQRRASEGLRLAAPAASVRRAGFVAELAAIKMRCGEGPSSAASDLIYLGG